MTDRRSFIKGALTSAVAAAAAPYAMQAKAGETPAKWDMTADIVVCGRFDLKKRNVYLQFRGSTNQRIIRRKGKYKHYQIQDGETATILTINSDGNFNIKGFYTEDIATLSKMAKNN